MRLTIKYICEQIWKLESNYDLLNRNIQGIKVWQLLRMNIYYDIAQKTGVFGQPHTRRTSLVDKFKALPSFLYSSLRNNPLFETTKRIIIFDHPRKKNINGKYIDIYTKYLIDSLNREDILVLEDPYMNKHFSVNEIERKHTDYLHLLSFILGKFNPVSLDKQEIDFIKKLESEIYLLFRIKIDLYSKFIKAIKQYKIRYKLYDQLFKKLEPEVIYTVVAYGNGTLIAAAKANKIPVVEIQHGTISPYHLGYSFPNCKNELEYFPDYFFSFGKFWTDSVRLPISKDKIIDYGFPYFNVMKKAYENLPKKPKQLLFLSQGVIGKELSKLASKAASELKDYHIIYKLHPGEYDRWKDEYIELNSMQQLKNLTIIDNDKVNLYKFIAESQYQVGVFSTAIYEGIAFKCKTILVNLPGIEYMKYLVEEGFVKKINNFDDLKEVLTQDAFKEIEIDYFFKQCHAAISKMPQFSMITNRISRKLKKTKGY